MPFLGRPPIFPGGRPRGKKQASDGSPPIATSTGPQPLFPKLRQGSSIVGVNKRLHVRSHRIQWRHPARRQYFEGTGVPNAYLGNLLPFARAQVASTLPTAFETAYGRARFPNNLGRNAGPAVLGRLTPQVAAR